tara:strand:- start:64304 stop:64432 length:129 start_codon:yes stop_codon:yes gene_type:complete
LKIRVSVVQIRPRAPSAFAKFDEIKFLLRRDMPKRETDATPK